MGPQRRKFPKRYAHELLRLAKLDLDAARLLVKARDSKLRLDPAMFLVQQSVEKALKAVLCNEGEPLPLTHDIYALVLLVEKFESPPHGFNLHDLTPYATVRRYEEGAFEPSEEDAQAAISSAEDVIRWGERRLKLG